MDDIEFEGDEVLPGQEDSPSSRVTRIVLALVGAAVAIAVIVTLAVRGGDNGDPSAGAPSGSALPNHPSFAPASHVPDPNALVDPVPVSPCDEVSGDGLSCSVTGNIPKPVVQAVRAAFPGARVTEVRTVIAARSDAIFERSITARAGKQRISITVESTNEDQPDITTVDAPTGAVVGATHDIGDRRVTVTLPGKAGDPLHDNAERRIPVKVSSSTKVVRLSKDRRLLALR